MAYTDTASSGMLLLFVAAFLWMIMDIRFQELTAAQKRLALLLIPVLAVCNEGIHIWFGMAVLRKWFVLTMHLPFFLLFRYLTKCGSFKMMFVIFSAMIFSALPTFFARFIRQIFPAASWVLYGFDAAGYLVMLLLVQVVFRRGFNYLLKYGDNRMFIPFFLVGIIHYVYTFAIWSLSLARFNSFGGILIRYLPTLQVFLFYFSLLHNYQDLSEKRNLEAAQAALGRELDAAEDQITRLNEAQSQSALYRHDMRHHLAVISGFLTEGNTCRAEEYIQEVYGGIEAITPRRFCENRLVDLLCSSFAKRAEEKNVRLTVETGLPEMISLPDTELCAIISNALENALIAAAGLEESRRWISFYCGVRAGKLLLEIKNPYDGHIALQDGIPVSRREGHGHGCRSIRAIAGRHRGLCVFEPKDGIFTLHIALPIQNKEGSGSP